MCVSESHAYQHRDWDAPADTCELLLLRAGLHADLRIYQGTLGGVHVCEAMS